jgi:branched-chain amino acid transport system permease protein
VYTLLALGFVVVFKASGVVNFAHPALLLVGAYVTARLTAAGAVPFALALLGGAAAAVAVAIVVQRLLVQRMAGSSVIAVSIMTIGVDVVVQTEIIRRISVNILPVGDPWRDSVLTVAGVR